MLLALFGVLSALLALAVPVLVLLGLVRLRRLEQRISAGNERDIATRLAALERRETAGAAAVAGRVEDLAARLAALEGQARALTVALDNLTAAGPTLPPRPAMGIPASPPSPVQAAAAVDPAESVRAPGAPSDGRADGTTEASSAPTRRGLDLESVIAGQWLHRIGIVALLLAVAFFLKYAFDNNWVGPRGRVAIGLVAGTSLLVLSQELLRRGYRYFSEGMAGLGAGVLYLSLFAAWSFYGLLPQPMAFGGMIAVTAAMIAIAVGRDSQSIALLALLGGFLTPAMLSTGRDAQIQLFGYLALLNGGLLALARIRNWPSLEPVAFAGTVLYYWGWHATYYAEERLWRTLAFATLFFVEFSALPVIHTQRLGRIRREQVLLVLLNAFWFLLALHDMLYREHRWALTVAVLLLAAAHLAVARALARSEAGSPSIPQLLFAGLALTFVTLAIPIRLEGEWIPMAWAVEGAVLVWSGFRTRLSQMRWAGLGLFGVATVRLAMFPLPDPQRFLLNPRFGVFAITVACLGVAVFLAQRNRASQSDRERQAFDLVGLAINVLALWGLSMEVWDVCNRMGSDVGIDAGLARQLGLSLLWTVYAAGLVVCGVRGSSPAVRWQGLALFALVVGKAFFFDLTYLQRAYRIVSFMGLGVLLVAVSFLYQRKLVAGQPMDPS